MNGKKRPVRKIKKEDGHYDRIINRMDRDIEKLKAKNKVLMEALKATESYLISISKDKTIQEIFQEVIDNTKINVDEKCPKCQAQGMKCINLGFIKIVSCSCGYRNRINESKTNQT